MQYVVYADYFDQNISTEHTNYICSDNNNCINVGFNEYNSINSQDNYQKISYGSKAQNRKNKDDFTKNSGAKNHDNQPIHGIYFGGGGGIMLLRYDIYLPFNMQTTEFSPNFVMGKIYIGYDFFKLLSQEHQKFSLMLEYGIAKSLIHFGDSTFGDNISLSTYDLSSLFGYHFDNLSFTPYVKLGYLSSNFSTMSESDLLLGVGGMHGFGDKNQYKFRFDYSKTVGDASIHSVLGTFSWYFMK